MFHTTSPLLGSFFRQRMTTAFRFRTQHNPANSTLFPPSWPCESIPNGKRRWVHVAVDVHSLTPSTECNPHGGDADGVTIRLSACCQTSSPKQDISSRAHTPKKSQEYHSSIHQKEIGRGKFTNVIPCHPILIASIGINVKPTALSAPPRITPTG